MQCVNVTLSVELISVQKGTQMTRFFLLNSIYEEKSRQTEIEWEIKCSFWWQDLRFLKRVWNYKKKYEPVNNLKSKKIKDSNLQLYHLLKYFNFSFFVILE